MFLQFRQIAMLTKKSKQLQKLIRMPQENLGISKNLSEEQVHFAFSDVKRVSLDHLRVRGWFVGSSEPTLVMKIGGLPEQKVTLRIRREDVAKKYELPPEKNQVGFVHFFQIGQERLDFAPEDIVIQVRALNGNDCVLERSYTYGRDVFSRQFISSADIELEPHPFRTVWHDNLDPEMFSVVLGVYNGEAYLQKAIDSVLSQTYENFEFIIVDDGSTDGSRGIIEAAAKKDARIVPVYLPNNMGQCAGFNAGISLARGAVTCFLDADDFWFNNKLEKLRALVASSNDDTTLYQHNLEICREDVLTGRPFRPSLLIGDVINHARQTGAGVPGPFIPTAGLAFPTEVLRAVYPIPQRFRVCADGYLTRSCAAFGETSGTNECLGAYRIHGSNNTIENSSFDGQAYVDKTLIPEMNKFYRKVKSSVRLPNRAKTVEIAPLRNVMPIRTDSKVSYASRHRETSGDIRELKDCYRGRRGFIVATGPSLKVEDLDMLKDEVTFSCNKITLGFNETDWRPTFYSIIDSVVSDTFEYDFNSFNSIKVFPADMQKYYDGLKNTFFVKNLAPRYKNEERQFEFSRDLRVGCGGGYTVIYLLMQLAHYVGIEELYLLGLDFSFSYETVSDKRSPKNEPIIISSGERNHFHKDYRAAGDQWTLPRLDLQRNAFAKAKEAFEADGRRIFNASRKTELDLFERVNLDDVLALPSSSSVATRKVEGLEAFARIQKAEAFSRSGLTIMEGWVWPAPHAIEMTIDGQNCLITTEVEEAGRTTDNHTFTSPITRWRVASVISPTAPKEATMHFIYEDGEEFRRTKRLTIVNDHENLADPLLETHWKKLQH